jgi:hypothetical protein
MSAAVGFSFFGLPPPAEVGEEDCTIMALIDRQYLARPY